MIRFIYLGQVEVEEENLQEFLATAKDLKIKGLSEENISLNTSSSTHSKLNEEDLIDTLNNTQHTGQCQHCEYKTAKFSHLKRHILSKHEGVTYPCEHCDYKATQTAHLKRHVLRVHTK